MTSAVPVQVQLIARSDELEVSTPFTAASATSHSIALVGLSADREWMIEAVAYVDGVQRASATTSFTTGPLPDYLPDYQIETDPSRMAPGYTLAGAIAFGGEESQIASTLGFDQNGDIVWAYQYAGGVTLLEQTSRGTFLGNQAPFGLIEFDMLGNTVRRWQIDGTAGAVSGAGPLHFDADVMPGLAENVAGFEDDPPAIPVRADWVTLTSFHHENTLMPNGNILTLSSTVHELTDEQRQTFCPGDTEPYNVVSDVVVEMALDGTVLRTWDLWDAIDINETPGSNLCLVDGGFASPLERDWNHANSVIYDAHRNAIIVSSRHTDQVVALRHLDAQGPQHDVLWVLGADGTLTLIGDPPYHQHGLELQADGSLLMYDNGNGRPGTTVDSETSPTYSRAVQFAIDDSSPDPTNWTATQTWEFITPDVSPGTPGQPTYAKFVGDANRLSNGNVLVDNGGMGTPYNRARVVEVVPNDGSGGDIVFDLRMGSERFGVAAYRAIRIPSFYVGEQWVAAPG